MFPRVFPGEGSLSRVWMGEIVPYSATSGTMCASGTAMKDNRSFLSRPFPRLLLGMLFLAGASLLLAGCLDGVARRKAEKAILGMLPEVLGPAESYEVHVEGSASELTRGYLRAVSIAGVNVSPRDLPKMTRMEASASAVRVDTKTKSIVESGPAAWSGWVNEETATGILADKARFLQDVKVTIASSGITASGRTTVKGVGPSGSVQVKPSIRGGTMLWMTPVKVSAMGVGLPMADWSSQRLEPIINPVFVVPESPLGIRLTGVSTEAGLLRIDGTLNLQGLTPAAEGS